MLIRRFKILQDIQRMLYLKQNKRYCCSSHFKNRRKQLSLDYTSSFYDIYPRIKEDVMKDQLMYFTNLPHLNKRYSDFMDYVCIQIPLYHAAPYVYIHATKFFEKSSNLTTEKMEKTYIMAWCIKLITGAMLVCDDLIDKQTFRYDKPTWMSLNDIGTTIMDANFLETSTTFLLIRHFSKHPQFENILKEMTKSYASVCLSTTLELQPCTIDEYENRENFVKAYPFLLPIVKCAMYAANIVDPTLHSIAEKISIKITDYLKIEDDVIDIICSSAETQKDQTDISSGKITWPAVQVAKYGTQFQKEVFTKNFGINDKEAVSKIHNIYKELKIREKFKTYEEEFYNSTYECIQKLPPGLPKEFFIDMLDFAVLGQFRA